jgi:transposase
MGVLFMSDKERLRKAYMEMVVLKKITLLQASQQLGVSYRQAKRLYKRYRAENDAGLIHRSRGQQSNRQHPKKEIALQLYQEKYIGFGPTLAAEKLAEDDHLFVNHETLREWLIAKNLWIKQRKSSPHRRQRECRAQFGELIQIDGSIHDWLEDGTHRCLMNMVDDATGKTLSHLDESETTSAVFNIIWNWIERYGIPLALYVDLKNVYVTLKDTTYSHLELACAKLGIQIIKAYSPQAKGRVERNHAVYQDRFVKELRLKKIKTLVEANAILKDGFVEKLNQKFEKVARNPNSAHRPLNNIDLNQVFCWEYERQIQHDWTFSIRTQIFQVKNTMDHSFDLS